MIVIVQKKRYYLNCIKMNTIIYAGKRSILTLFCLFSFGVLASEGATNYYVATNGLGGGFTNWATAASNIQDAINVTIAGDTIWVSNGVYNTGGITNWPSGTVLTNRIAITKAITVRSTNGPAVTTIMGARDPATTNGPAAVRCVYMAANSKLIGFTLTNGATLTDNEAADVDDMYGGGIYSPNNTAIISNCALTGNSAERWAGGAHYGSFYNCTLIGNTAKQRGGASYEGIFYNCTITDNILGNGAGDTYYGGGGLYSGSAYNCLVARNTASKTGGVRGTDLYNCTIVSNRATGSNGGSYGGNIYNSIIYFNSPDNWTYTAGSRFYYSCTTPSNTTTFVTGNTTNDPTLVEVSTSNYRLQAGSPCVNTGTNASWTRNSVDLDGHSRIDHFSGVVDMGCYEYVRSGAIVTLK